MIKWNSEKFNNIKTLIKFFSLITLYSDILFDLFKIKVESTSNTTTKRIEKKIKIFLIKHPFSMMKSDQLVFSKKYETNRNNLLGSGSFGDVYLVKEILTKKK